MGDPIYSQNHPRTRLLEAAGQLFCEKGFDRTSVRELTALAGCNVAAVNYHFGGKYELYVEMFRCQMRQSMQECMTYMEDVMASPDPSLENLLRGWVTPPLKAVERDEPRTRIILLMVREIMNQTLDAELVTHDLKEAFVVKMGKALQQLVPGLRHRQAHLAVFSLDALMFHPLLFARFYMGWIEGIDMDAIIDHIVRFAAAGIRSYARK